MSAIRIRGIDHVVVRVRDCGQALRFYCDTLGCSVERRIDELGLIQLRAGSSLIDLIDVASPLGKTGGAGPGAEGRNMDHFAVELVEFDEAALRSHLEAHGVEPGDVAQRYGARGAGPSMYIRDPEGNVVELKGPPNES
jgi:catechol 2,3-dioxygenase-like lactoylglutathione lyase family enzyme